MYFYGTRDDLYQFFFSIRSNRLSTVFIQGLCIIFQMDWKRYVITIAKILPSSLHPEVYPEMSDSTAAILDWGAKTVNMAI